MAFVLLIGAIFACAIIMPRLAADAEPVKERAEPVSCMTCGTPTWLHSGQCTRCRTPAQAPPTERMPIVEAQPRLPEVDAHGNLIEDVRCRRCSYNLRGLSPMGQCPECEMHNARSLFGDQLRHSEPRWIRRLHQGIWLLLIGILATIGGVLLGAIAMAMFFGATGGTMPSGSLLALFSAGMTLASFIWIAGVWLLTTPDPGTLETEKPVSARSLARWCTMATVASIPIGALQQQSMMAPGATLFSGALDAILFVFGTVFGLVVLVGTAAGIVYLRSLALRIPATGLAQQTKIAGWGYIVTAVIAQFFGLAWQAFGPGGMVGGPIFGVATALGCVVGIGSLVFGIWMFVLLIRYAAAFGHARQRAEQFARTGAVIPTAGTSL